MSTNEQAPAPVAGDEAARPASDQPVEAIGAGREEIAGPPREPTQTMMDALLYHSSADTTWGDAYTMWTAAHDAWFRDEPARPASEQPVEAIGAGREEIEQVIAALEIPYPFAAWEGDCRGSHIQARKNAKALIERLAALSPASPAPTPMGGEVERLKAALEQIANPPYGLGFNKLRRIARKALSQPEQSQ